MQKNFTLMKGKDGKELDKESSDRTAETKSLLGIAKTHTGELRAVAELISESKDIALFKEEISNLVNHLSHDIDDVLGEIEAVAERPVAATVV